MTKSGPQRKALVFSKIRCMSASGLGNIPPTHDTQRIEVFGWTLTSIERIDVATMEEALASLSRFRFAWIDVEGVAIAEAVAAIEAPLQLPPLACDTLIEGIRRPGADDFDDVTIVTMRAHLPTGGVEFIDFLLAPQLLVTLQEKSGGDVFTAVRERLKAQSQRLIHADASVLFLLLGRAVCESYRPVLAHYSESLEKFERALVRRPDASMLDRIHEHRRQLLFLRQGLAPLREALANLLASLAVRMEEERRMRARLGALRELQDEVGALLDLVEFQKDSAQHLLDLYLNAASNRLNEIVRVLTIISVIFMPLTLIAGIYGMNFETDSPWSMPELRWQYGYPFALGLMAISVLSFLYFFWRKGWIGDPLRHRKHGGILPGPPSTRQIDATWPMSLMLSRRKPRPTKGTGAKHATPGTASPSLQNSRNQQH